MLNPSLPLNQRHPSLKPKPHPKPPLDEVRNPRRTTRTPLPLGLVAGSTTRPRGDIDKKYKLPRLNYEILSLPFEFCMVHRPRNRNRRPTSNLPMDLLMD